MRKRITIERAMYDVCRRSGPGDQNCVIPLPETATKLKYLQFAQFTRAEGDVFRSWNPENGKLTRASVNVGSLFLSLGTNQTSK